MVTAADEGWLLTDGNWPTFSSREHEIRVCACLAGGCDNLILRCSCGTAWDMETGRTLAELNQVAAQHSRTA